MVKKVCFVFLVILFFSANSIYALNLYKLSEDKKNAGNNVENYKDKKVNIIADSLEYLQQDKKVVGKGNVIVTYGDIKMTADYAELHSVEKEVFVKGHIVVKRNNEEIRGSEGRYDFSNDSGEFKNGIFKNFPFIGKSEHLEQVSENLIRGKNAEITTCSYAMHPHLIPHYHFKAEYVNIYPDDKIVAYNVKVYILGKPVFWLPIIHIPLDDGHAPFDLKPGYSSEDGFYALASKRYKIAKNIGGKVHIDYRHKRGWGYGNDIDYYNKIAGNGFVKVYLTRDKKTPNDKTALPYENLSEDDRYRVSWRHRKVFGNTVISAEINKFSDRYFLKDLFKKEYNAEADPETYFNVTHTGRNYGIFLNIEKRVNNFVDTIEKLPEVRFNWFNREIGRTGIYYKQEDDVTVFNRKRAHSDIDDDVVRFDSFHEISRPMKVNIFALKPYMNYRFDYYSKNKFGEENLTRHVIGGGVDFNTKFYRIFDVSTDFLGLNINRLRHILEPSIKYESVRMRSVLPGTLFQMDDIDAIDDKDTVTFGIDNRLQTKRIINGVEKTVNIVSYNTYLVYDFKNETCGGSTFLNWTNEVVLRPYDWMSAKFKFIYDVPNDQFSSADLDLQLREKGKWHLYLQHKFLKEGSKQLTVDAMYRLNDKWGIGGYVRTEFDEGTVNEEWEIRATRDLHCWYLDFGYNVRNSEIDSSNKELFFQLSLKAYPDYPLKSGHHATLSRARIGKTVAGSFEDADKGKDFAMLRY